MVSLADNVRLLEEMVRDCTLCPRHCHVARTAGQVGACSVGAKAVFASAGPHFGEEPVLVGKGGSGTIFFAGCNLHCVFCQNYDISQLVSGPGMSGQQLASHMLNLQQQGCENINFVSPSHVAHVVARAISLACSHGLTISTVYNSGGYDSVRTLRLLDGLIDIYMPDFKYADPEAGKRYSGVSDYPRAAQAALAEMYRQVGPLEVGGDGVATRGVMVRHLVMPSDIARSDRVVETIARTAPGCAINVMSQYRPAYRAGEYPELKSTVPRAEIDRLRRLAENHGLRRV